MIAIKPKSIRRNVSRSLVVIFGTISAATFAPQDALASATPFACLGATGSALPWKSASGGYERHLPPLVRQTLSRIQDDVGGSVDAFVATNTGDIATYIFKVQVLQNKHPGYYFRTRIYFDCDRGDHCQSFDFARSRTINFPRRVDVYRKAQRVVLVAHGYDETSGVRSVERFLIVGDKLTKC